MLKGDYQRKQLWVFAGPNGAGKSTFVNKYFQGKMPVVNPDNIALKIAPQNHNDPKVVLQAGKEAFKERLQKIEQNRSFAIETTFSGRSELRLMGEAKEKGYKVNLVYIGIENKETSLKRVADRVAKGGHSVPEEDIERRFERSMKNLKEGMILADRTCVLDNSKVGQKPVLMLKKEQEKVVYLNKNPSSWFKKIIDDMPKRYLVKKKEK